MILLYMNNVLYNFIIISTQTCIYLITYTIDSVFVTISVFSN